MSKDDKKTFVVIILVCIICIVAAIIMSIKSNMDEIESVSEYNVFFSNVNYINDYITYISNKDNKAVFELLDDEYILNNNITVNNVLDGLEHYSSGSFLKAKSMKFVRVKNNFIYYITGIILENNFDGNVVVDDNFSIILKTDFDNLSFSLYPVNDDNYDEVINGIKKIIIENNEYNDINQSDLISKEQVCIVYLSDFINYLSDDISIAYNLLSEDMKTIYTDVNVFSDYVNQNISLFTTGADKCMVQNVDNNRVYSIIDNNNNSYVFTEESVMNYKVSFYLKDKISE